MRTALTLLIVVVVVLAGHAQTPPRDQPRVAAIGSGAIAGTVVADDAARAPLRNAIVTLSRGSVEDMRSTPTDEQGRFAFGSLPAGSYTLSVSKGAYIAMSYGAPKPGMPGSSIVLTEGQAFVAKPFALMRGAVIAGRLTDRGGQPVATTVRADQFVIVNGERRRRTATGATGTSFTNAHGEFRIFGLLPGDYVVSAAPPPIGVQGEVTSAELMWANQPSGPAPSPARSFTPAPTMFPGTTTVSAGVVITLGRSEERLGVDFAIQYVPVSLVSGKVTAPDGRPAVNAVVLCALGNRNAFLPPSDQIISSTGAEGAFTCPGGLAPGQYVFAARFVPPPPAGAAPATQTSTPLWGFTELNIAGRDISNVAIQLQPGLSVSGQTVFKPADAGGSPDPTGVQLRLILVNPTLPVANVVASVRSDGTFQFDGVVPGSYRLMGTPTGASGRWMLRSAMLGGKDVADMPIDIPQNMSGLVVTFTDLQTELSGTLADGAGHPSPQLYVFVFPADKTLWTLGARRVQYVRSSENGSYRITGLPAGEYYLCALTELETALQFEPTYLEQFVPASIKITLGEGEKKTQNLRIGG